MILTESGLELLTESGEVMLAENEFVGSGGLRSAAAADVLSHYLSRGGITAGGVAIETLTEISHDPIGSLSGAPRIRGSLSRPRIHPRRLRVS